MRGRFISGGDGFGEATQGADHDNAQEVPLVPFAIILGARIHAGIKTRNGIYTRLIRQRQQSDDTFLSIAVAP
jgi:hypothetical protein